MFSLQNPGTENLCSVQGNAKCAAVSKSICLSLCFHMRDEFWLFGPWTWTRVHWAGSSHFPEEEHNTLPQSEGKKEDFPLHPRAPHEFLFPDLEIGGLIALERDTSFPWMGKPVLSSAGTFRFLWAHLYLPHPSENRACHQIIYHVLKTLGHKRCLPYKQRNCHIGFIWQSQLT